MRFTDHYNDHNKPDIAPLNKKENRALSLNSVFQIREGSQVKTRQSWQHDLTK